jgi:hypothetical protein
VLAHATCLVGDASLDHRLQRDRFFDRLVAWRLRWRRHLPAKLNECPREFFRLDKL